jgi:hypothetical protein
MKRADDRAGVLDGLELLAPDAADAPGIPGGPVVACHSD